TPDSNGSDLLMPDTVRQQEAAWCWAAVGQMIFEKLKDTSITQCGEANNRFRLENCCHFPTPDACIRGGTPEFLKYGFLADSTDNHELSWEEIKKQIDCLKAPICASWMYVDPAGRPNGGGHMAVISAYKRTDS